MTHRELPPPQVGTIDSAYRNIERAISALQILHEHGEQAFQAANTRKLRQVIALLYAATSTLEDLRPLEALP